MNKKAVIAATAVVLMGFPAFASDDEVKPVETTLRDVVGCPDAFTRFPFKLEILFHATGTIYNPFYTLFEPTNYLNFSAWGTSSKVWRKEEYVADHPFFYVQRRNVALQQTILNTTPFTWLEARCIVRSASGGKAWIEILDLEKMDENLHWAELQKLVRGWVLTEQGQHERALAEFNSVDMDDFTDSFSGLCKLEMGRCALAAGRFKEAVAHLRYARKIFPDDPEVAYYLGEAVASRSPKGLSQVATTPAPATAPAAPAPATQPPVPVESTEQKVPVETPKVEEEEMHEWPEPDMPAPAKPAKPVTPPAKPETAPEAKDAKDEAKPAEPAKGDETKDAPKDEEVVEEVPPSEPDEEGDGAEPPEESEEKPDDESGDDGDGK